MNMNHRYSGRPFLRFLELYILKTIEEISLEDAERMEDMTPLLRKIYGHDGDWSEIIMAAMGISERTNSDIRRMWEENQKIARRNNAYLSAQQFAEMIADENFVRD